MIIKHSGRQRRLVAVAAFAAGLFTMTHATGVSAANDCEPRTVTQSFLAWGDDSWYFPIPGGTFESSGDWDLSNGATISRGNEWWRVLGANDHRSLLIPAGASASSPTFCVAADEDALRLFVRRPDVDGSGLLIHIQVSNGSETASDDIVIAGSRQGWSPTQRMLLPDLRDEAGMQWVTVTFTPINNTASWKIDDVQLDPWKTR